MRQKGFTGTLIAFITFSGCGYNKKPDIQNFINSFSLNNENLSGRVEIKGYYSLDRSEFKNNYFSLHQDNKKIITDMLSIIQLNHFKLSQSVITLHNRYEVGNSSSNSRKTKIYAIGGSNGYSLTNVFLSTNEEYDPETDTWKKRAPMPTPRDGLVAVTVNGKIYAIGGVGKYGLLSTNEEYDPVTDTWRRRAPMPTLRDEAAAAVVNDKIYVVGGLDTSYSRHLSINEEYDPKTNTWTRKAPMPTPRNAAGAAAVNNKIYVIGGGGEIPDKEKSHERLSVNEEYDPITDSWRERAPLPLGNYPSVPLVVAVNNKIYAIMEGKPKIGKMSNWANAEYDPETDSWTEKKGSPIGRDCPAAAVANGKIYVIGGYNAGRALSANYEYDPATDKWRKRKPMPTPRCGLAAVSAP